MVKLQSKTIDEGDLTEYLTNCSDFSFEIRAYQALTDLRFDCDHGGTYTDSVTGKKREFDVQAFYPAGKYSLALAVECKNIGLHCPLLVECVSRPHTEAFVDLLFTGHTTPDNTTGYPVDENCVELIRQGYYYSNNKPVGKSCVQVGRDLQGSVGGSDSEFYAKWSQAISSSEDIIEKLAISDHGINHFTIWAVFPIVVVPNETLWQAEYDLQGKLTSGPSKADHVSYYVGHEYEVRQSRYYPHKDRELTFTFSHVEIVTFKGLTELATSLSRGRLGEQLFRDSQIRSTIRSIDPHFWQ